MIKTSLVFKTVSQYPRAVSKMMRGHGRDTPAMMQMLKRVMGDRVSYERISATVMTGQTGRMWSTKWSRTAG